MSSMDRKAWASLMAGGLLLGTSAELPASGPFFERMVFVHTHFPDHPYENFVAGKLGVLHPTYYRANLYIAYRNLVGKGFDEREQQALAALWDQNVRRDWMSVVAFRDEQADIKLWLDARGNFPRGNPEDQIRVYRGGFWNQTYYIGYLNCPGDAFHNAAETLQKRRQQFGAGSSLVQEWVKAQDQVFSNCSGPGTLPHINMPWLQQEKNESAEAHPTPVIPTEAAPGTPAILKADRAYQIAAAYFYAGLFDDAEKRFAEIAKDSSSPWRTLAPYLAIRALIRKATLGSGPEQVDRALLAEAATRLSAILQNPGLGGIHHAAARLLNLVRLKLDPDTRRHELAERLMTGGSPESLTQDVIDYTVLLDKVLLAGPPGDWPRKNKPLKDIPPRLFQDDLTDWILTYQSGDDAAREHALGKWKMARSLPWLVAVITRIHGDDSGLGSILAAAARVAPDSPAYLTASYHTLRLLVECGKRADARHKLDDLLAHQNWKGETSALNLFLSQRMSVARNLDEFLRYSPRVIAGFTYEGQSERYIMSPGDNLWLRQLAQDRVAFDADAARVLNEGLPLGMLKEAATREVLPAHLRRRVALATWVRAFLLGNDQVALDLVPTVEKLAPELKENLGQYRDAKDAQSRQDAGVLTLLKFPGLRPYVMSGAGRQEPLEEFSLLRDNWWCALDPVVSFDFPNYVRINLPFAESLENAKSTRAPPLAPFLSGAEKNAARDELKRLAAVEVAPSYLGRRVLAWARKHPDDTRVPWALSIVVRLPRRGCPDAKTGEFSRTAFRLLHQRYPNSLEAKKTKYWYR